MHASFTTQIHPIAATRQDALWFIFQDEHILLEKTPQGFIIPKQSTIHAWPISYTNQHYLGLLEQVPCFVAQYQDKKLSLLPDNVVFQPIREAYHLLHHNEALCHVVTRAKQILHWDQHHQFCGRCGTKTQMSETERAKICPKCQTLFFPQVAPVMLALVFRGDEILLARSPHFTAEVYSILAGFAEPGETIEQTVMREIKEEVNLTVKNICYVGSQPWPFSSNLLLGFTAEYDHGNIQIDPKEIEEAGWFSKHHLPPLPPHFTLSRRMIERWKNK